MNEERELTPWERVAPAVYNVATVVMTGSFIVAGLATLYLLYGVFSGQLAGMDSLPKGDQTRILGAIRLAGQVLTGSLALGTLALATLLIIEETTGYVIAAAALAIGWGIPFAYQTFGGNLGSTGLQAAFGAFQSAAYVPLAIGAALIVKDVIARFKSALSQKVLEVEDLTFGSDAKAERLPLRTNVLAKCWEGPYCRESIRVHCPIFVAKKTCWKELQGCYCEEDIVLQAAQRAQATPLQMAPDSRYNFANSPTPGLPNSSAPVVPGNVNDPANKAGLSSVGSAPRGGPIIMSITAGGMATEEEFVRKATVELTDSQKRQRCKNCIIYNEHMREKYKLLMPVVLAGGIILCVVLAPALREGIAWSFTGMERVAARLTFNTGPIPKFQRPPAPVEWAMVGAFSLMIVSKLLQGLEWMCFKAKI
jgi:hypothetical protein